MTVRPDWRRSTRRRRVRPNKTDDGIASARRLLSRCATMNKCDAADAPEVAAEFDRPGLASRPEAEIQRPVAPGADAPSRNAWLWVAAAVVLGVVLAVAGAAILMRQKPQDLAIKPPVEAQQPGSPAAFARRSPSAFEANPRAPPSTPAGAFNWRADKQASRPLRARQRRRPSAPETSTEPDAASAGARAVGRARGDAVASADNPQKPAVSLGSTVWSLIPPAPNQPATVGGQG